MAVSARPFRAPWVERKYSSTESPSRKLERIGSSMMPPDGSAIRPHPGHLRDLLDVSLRPGLGHHRDRPERVERFVHGVGHEILRPRPDRDDLVVPLLIGDEAAPELLLDV